MARDGRTLLAHALLAAMAATRTNAMIAHGIRPPKLPRQFTAKASVISHLADRTLEYPPWQTVYELAYDFENKRVAAKVLEGFDAGSTFYRQYDRKWEYQVTEGQFADCKRAYITEDLPEPELPETLTLLRQDDEWEGRRANVWSTQDEFKRVTVWQDADTGLAVAVQDEGYDNGKLVPLMTHRFDDMRVGRPEPTMFELPYEWSHKKCAKYPGGWPWIHFFDIYLMG